MEQTEKGFDKGEKGRDRYPQRDPKKTYNDLGRTAIGGASEDKK